MLRATELARRSNGPDEDDEQNWIDVADTAAELLDEGDALEMVEDELDSNPFADTRPLTGKKYDSDAVEWMVLRLPSQLKESASQDPRFAEARAEELRLRCGQANDTLHQIRILLSEKSFTLRKHVHPARAQRYKTRAWSEFHSIEANVHHHAKIYRKARVAMIKLGAVNRRSTEIQGASGRAPEGQHSHR